MGDWEDDLDDSWGRDDLDIGWGERTWSDSSSTSDPEDLDRFLRDRPPHYSD